MRYIKDPIMAYIIHDELDSLQVGIELKKVINIMKDIRKNSSNLFYSDEFIHIFHDSKNPKQSSYRNLGFLRALKILNKFKDVEKTSYSVTDLGKYLCKYTEEKELLQNMKNILQYLYSINILIEFIKDNKEITKEDVDRVLGKEMIYYNKKLLGKAIPKPFNKAISGELLRLLLEFKLLNKNPNSHKYYY